MLSLVETRLKEHGAPLERVEMLEDLDALANMAASHSGDLFVIPFRERGSPNKHATSFRQKVSVQVLVAVLLRFHNDPSGRMKAAQFDAYTGAIERALAGWEPTEWSDPFELVGGEATPLGNNKTVYIQTWETSRFLTQEDD